MQIKIMKKKFENVAFFQKRGFIKILIAMKFTLFFILITVAQVFATTYSQTTKFSLNLQETTLSQILEEIENQSNFRFLYNDDLLEDKSYPRISYSDKTIDEILTEVLDGSGNNYAVLDNNLIVITPAYDGDQSKQVRGVITTEDGEPLPGVTVVIKGTNKGTVSDVDGKYTLEKISDDAVLVFSFVGMKSQEILLGNQSVINLTMEMDALGIEEVVAIGYGTQTKATVTGSVVSTKGEDIVKSRTPNVENALTGLLSGVTVNQRSGEPGKDDATIVIRGMSTTGDTNPLILIDGIESSELSRINSADIESVSVLKDASAAIYGARAANGVILVTTKSGQKGAPAFSFDYNQGFSQPTRTLKMADSYTWAQVYNEILASQGQTLKYSENDLQKFKEGKEDGYTTTDFFKETIKTLTPQSQTNLSVSGGTDKIDYFMSLGYINQDGMFKSGSLNVKRYNFRSKISVQATNYLKIGLDVSGRQSNNHYPVKTSAETLGHLMLYQPDWTYHWPGTNYLRGLRDNENMLINITDDCGTTNETLKNLESKLYFKLDIPWVKGLAAIGSANINTGNSFTKRFDLPTYVYYKDGDDYIYARTGDGSDYAELYETYTQNTTTTLNAQINYDKSFGEQSLNLMAGYEQMQYSYDYLYAYRTDFPSTALEELNAGSSDKYKQGNAGTGSSTARQNFFGRAIYDYAGKYMAQVIFRYDGSPNFHKDKRWGFFPGISLGWRISEESFMQNFGFVQNLKIRGSYGELGNDNVDAFQYLTTYSYGSNYVLGNNDVIGLVQSSVPNPYITWEVAKSTNIGFDATLWDGLLGVEFDYFYTKRENILTTRNAIIPDYTGLELPDENLGIVDNRGIDLHLTHMKRISDDFSYSLIGNFSVARNKVIFTDEAPAAEEYQLATGRPIGSELFYLTDGIYKDQAQVDASVHMTGAQPGDLIYVDYNKDKVIDNKDMVRFDETTTPRITYSLIGKINCKAFDFSIMFQGQEKAMINIGGDMSYAYYTVMSYNLGNFLAWRADDRWSPGNTDASQPRADYSNFNINNSYKSDHWINKAGFLRLKNVEFGYTLPSSVAQKVGLKGLRAYVNGSNLLILYDHMKDFGFDPETTSSVYYPQQRVFNIGVNMTF